MLSLEILARWATLSNVVAGKPNSTKSSRAASMIVWPSASLAGRPRRLWLWLFSVTTIPVLDSILILALRYHAVSKVCKPLDRFQPFHQTEPITMDDVIIIGGSFAGLAGALQLGRARRKVTVLDTGLPRNRFAGHSHGLLGHDHRPPLDILAEARQQLARYATVRLVNARADSVSGAIDDFSVLTSDGESVGARRLILSYGVAAQMPDVPGFAERGGTSILPCPYCDGFAFADQQWGLVWSGPQSHQSVRLYHDWTDTLTLFADGHDIPPDIKADLARRNIPVVDGRIIEIANHKGHITTVNLDTSRNIAVDILFAHPRNKPSASLHESLGLATVDTPVGIALD